MMKVAQRTDNEFTITRPDWVDDDTWHRLRKFSSETFSLLVDALDGTAIYTWQDLARNRSWFDEVLLETRQRGDLDPITNRSMIKASRDPLVGGFLMWNKTRDEEGGHLWMFARQEQHQERQVLSNAGWMISCGTVYSERRVGMQSYKARPDFKTKVDGDWMYCWALSNALDVEGLLRNTRYVGRPS